MIYRGNNESFVEIGKIKHGAKIDILVEAMGRVNYGPYLYDKKGILSNVRIGGQILFN